MSDDEIILVCARVRDQPLLIPDNLTGLCSECAQVVQYRPHAPRPFRLLCVECTIPIIPDATEIFTTPRMIEDALAYVRKKKLQ
jgi:hypothetical protein